VAEPDQIASMEQSYRAGNYGYGHAKQALYEALLQRFATQRARHAELMANPQVIEQALQLGEQKARAIAGAVLARVRTQMGTTA